MLILTPFFNLSYENQIHHRLKTTIRTFTTFLCREPHDFTSKPLLLSTPLNYLLFTVLFMHKLYISHVYTRLHISFPFILG